MLETLGVICRYRMRQQPAVVAMAMSEGVSEVFFSILAQAKESVE